MIYKTDGWESRLYALIELRKTTPIKFGENDCCLFVADCVEAMTGHDPAWVFRGRYDSPAGAKLCLEEFADGGVLETAEAISIDCGFPHVEIPFARRGDVGLFDCGRGDTLGIVVDGKICAPGDEGLVFLDVKICKVIWRVP